MREIRRGNRRRRRAGSHDEARRFGATSALLRCQYYIPPSQKKKCPSKTSPRSREAPPERSSMAGFEFVALTQLLHKPRPRCQRKKKRKDSHQHHDRRDIRLGRFCVGLKGKKPVEAQLGCVQDWGRSGVSRVCIEELKNGEMAESRKEGGGAEAMGARTARVRCTPFT